MKWNEKRNEEAIDSVNTTRQASTSAELHEGEKNEEMLQRRETTSNASNNVHGNVRDVTILQAKTTIQGNMDSSDDVIIYGTLLGDLNCEGDCTIYGSVQGNISCHSAIFKEARIEGNIECSSRLEISENTIIHGNASVVHLQNGGKIKGDVKVEETAHFLCTSALLGNITALEIQIDKGCILQGTVVITEKIDF